MTITLPKAPKCCENKYPESIEYIDWSLYNTAEAAAMYITFREGGRTR